MRTDCKIAYHAPMKLIALVAAISLGGGCRTQPLEVSSGDTADAAPKSDGGVVRDFSIPHSPFDLVHFGCTALVQCILSCGGTPMCLQMCAAQANPQTLNRFQSAQQCSIDVCSGASPAI